MADKKKPRRGDASRRPKDPEKSGRKYTYARTCYMTDQEDQLVVRAAEIERQSISAFITEASLERAMEVIRAENRRRALTGEDDPASQKRKRP